MNNLPSVSTRTYQKAGKWIKRPKKTEVLVCECGGKYIKTRDKQKSCLRCKYR